MILLAIVTATLAAGIGSVWLAALFGLSVLGRFTQHLLSLAAGALLATAFMHLLPEAFESSVEPKTLLTTLLIGVLFFFLLDKAELWHHGHEHHHGHEASPGHNHGYNNHAHQHHHHAHVGHDHAGAHAHGGGAQAGAWAIVAGDSVHCFGDGILIASAFVADVRLGWVAALSVLAHEVPHHMGDLIALRQSSGNDRRTALLKVSLAGAVTTLGGLAGYFLVEQLRDYLPYFLAVASSSFIYVALADLIPQLQRRLGARETLAQLAWLAIGMAMVTGVSTLMHGAAH